MANIQEVFQRYEKKYRMNEIQARSMLLEISNHMTRDEYGQHTISNLYYDTENYELIRASIEKPVYKEKLRLRSYGTVKATDQVFLELKKKYDGVVYKRRIDLPYQEAIAYLTEGKRPSKDCQILKEIDWFLKSYEPEAKVFLAYDRTAYFGKDDPNLRITFDENIRFRESMLDLSKGSWGTSLLPAHETLMEIKIPGAMPVWLAELLSELQIFSTSYSKYGACYQQYLMKNAYPNKGGIICA